MVKLENKVAIITGASSGIGASIAQVEYLIVDVTQQQEVERLIAYAKEQFGRLDILVNSAGQMMSSAVTDGNVKAWESMIDTNVKGTLYGINAVIPTFLAQSSGHIINIASISGFEVTKMSTIYSATKAAVHTITQGLEKELAKTGVRVTSISPGMVDTPLSGQTDWGERKKLEPKDIAEAVVYALQQPSHVNVNEITVRPV
ncbi:oxidoreductase [Staphylococcus cohnii]|nr:oxidoreductase [Staphylococcus cohnii]PUZ35891.1 SDR family NAD(P)-dependent oxidoreductase [Staphylococcus cohnii]